MCGITGRIGGEWLEADALRAVISASADRLRHRGPDSSGTWVDTERRVGLGHRRLAILDLTSAGAQPMLSASGRFVIAYNGETYNHCDIRDELAAAGAAPAWRGHSDTETLLAAIEAWGVRGALERASGMFALAVHDRAERKLYLARDRMGEKPLYWGWAGGALVFASELKALGAMPGFAGGVCPEAFAQYLRFDYVPAPRSIHPGVFKLEPGTLLEVAGDPPASQPPAPLRPGERHGSLSISRYWSLADVAAQGAGAPIPGDAEGVAALDRALSGAVRRQMISDVPVGVFLSGGIDSSLVAALMCEAGAGPVRSFTVGFDEAGFDEAGHAAAVARHLGTDHVEVRVSAAEARAVIPDLPTIYDEPFADSSQIPTHLVCRATRAHVSVALSGDGGDELFGGYNRHFWAPRLWSRLGSIPLPLRRFLGRALLATPAPALELAGRLLGIARPAVQAEKIGTLLGAARDLDGLYMGLVSAWPDPALLMAGVEREPPSLLADPLPEHLAGDPAARMMLQDMRSYLPDDILCKVDRAAMAVSLETRAPFLDPEVVALSARLPTRMKVRDGQGKWALREVLHRRVPQALVERPKMGFAIPLGQWLRGPLRAWAEELLDPARLAGDGLLDPAPVRRTWAEHLSGRRDHSRRLWTVLMFQAWREAGA